MVQRVLQVPPARQEQASQDLRDQLESPVLVAVAPELQGPQARQELMVQLAILVLQDLQVLVLRDPQVPQEAPERVVAQRVLRVLQVLTVR